MAHLCNIQRMDHQYIHYCMCIVEHETKHDILHLVRMHHGRDLHISHLDKLNYWYSQNWPYIRVDNMVDDQYNWLHMNKLDGHQQYGNLHSVHMVMVHMDLLVQFHPLLLVLKINCVINYICICRYYFSKNTFCQIDDTKKRHQGQSWKYVKFTKVWVSLKVLYHFSIWSLVPSQRYKYINKRTL